MSTYGIKISQPGIDVLRAEDKNLMYTSTLFGLKIYKTGTASITIPGGSADFSVHSVDIPHDLGYAPAFYAFVTDTNGDYIGINVPFISEMMDTTASLDAFAWSDTTKLRLSMTVVDGLVSDVTRTFKYYIFVEPTI